MLGVPEGAARVRTTCSLANTLERIDGEFCGQPLVFDHQGNADDP